MRYFLEQLGEYLRQYFFLGDRDERPFNRATRSWVYRIAKNEGGIIGFGSTYDKQSPGALLFVNAPFPVLEEDQLPTPPLVIGGGYCNTRFTGKSIVNVSGMSYGAISRPAVRALSWCGEGRVLDGHWGGRSFAVPSGRRLRRDFPDRHGPSTAFGTNTVASRWQSYGEVAAHEVVRAFEIKLSQGAKPGKGGVLPAAKVTDEIARIRGIPPGIDSISPNRHPDVANADELLDMIEHIRDITGKPVGVKTAVGWLEIHASAGWTRSCGAGWRALRIS